MSVTMKTVEKMLRVLDALVNEAAIDGPGNYLWEANLPDPDHPGKMIPSVVHDAKEVLREARAPRLTHESIFVSFVPPATTTPYDQSR